MSTTTQEEWIMVPQWAEKQVKQLAFHCVEAAFGGMRPLWPWGFHGLGRPSPAQERAIAQPIAGSCLPGAGTGEWVAGPVQRVTRAGPAALWARGWETAVGIGSPGHPEACPLVYTQDLWCCGKNASPCYHTHLDETLAWPHTSSLFPSLLSIK